MYASQKFQNFSAPRRPETHFRHAQGNQQAGAFLGSIINTQKQLLQNTE